MTGLREMRGGGLKITGLGERTSNLLLFLMCTNESFTITTGTCIKVNVKSKLTPFAFLLHVSGVIVN